MGTYQLDGGVTAVGDVTLDGSAILSGKPSYTFTALQDAGGGSGELTMGGVKSDGRRYLPQSAHRRRARPNRSA